ncbi:MAG: hypothetical protein R3C56_30025 [Pirellulaceae bacterium]
MEVVERGESLDYHAFGVAPCAVAGADGRAMGIVADRVDESGFL